MSNQTTVLGANRKAGAGQPGKLVENPRQLERYRPDRLAATAGMLMLAQKWRGGSVLT